MLPCAICGKEGWGQRFNGIPFCAHHCDWVDNEIADWNEKYEVVKVFQNISEVIFEGIKKSATQYYRSCWFELWQKSDPEDYNYANLTDKAFEDTVANYLDLFANGSDNRVAYYLFKAKEN